MSERSLKQVKSAVSANIEIAYWIIIDYDVIDSSVVILIKIKIVQDLAWMKIDKVFD